MKALRLCLPAVLATTMAWCASGASGPAATFSITNEHLLGSVGQASVQSHGEQPLPGLPLVGLFYDLALPVSQLQDSNLVAVRRLTFKRELGFTQRGIQDWDGVTTRRSGLTSGGVEAAERLNAQAMRRYRERWERYLSAPRSWPVPSLYPPKVEEASERAKEETVPRKVLNH